jgi:hypothetical protein
LAVIAIICFIVAQIYTILDPKYNFNLLANEEEFIAQLDDESNSKIDYDDSNGVKRSDTKSKSKLKTKKTSSNHKSLGYFNGRLFHHQPYEEGFHSNVHCIGDNFGKDAWKYRSCQFQNFCFDMHNKSFVLFTSPEQHKLEEAISHTELTEFSTAFSMNTTVSIGGINNKWGNDIPKMEWFPNLRSIDEIKKSGYYMFSNDDTTLLPYHSLAGFNPGHLVWDDFLPIYTILSMFQSLEDDVVLMRYKPKYWMWASCDRRWKTGKNPHCRDMLKKFLPLIGEKLETMTTQENFNLTWFSKNENENEQSQDDSSFTESQYICAPRGAAGLGMLTDHGPKLHGWMKNDYLRSQNFGRGGQLYEFRNWMLDNIGIDPYQIISKPKYRIVFSINSSTTSGRNQDFKSQREILQKSLGNKYELDIIAVKMSTMGLNEQIDLVAGASIMVSMCGGGAVTAMFLPKGASMLTYFNIEEKGGDTTPRLDWDLLNNLSYLRVHWLPRPRFTMQADQDAFVRLVDHELDIISHT